MKTLLTKKEFTRSFGDIDAKFIEFGGIPGIIIPEPHVKSFKIKENHDFIALGSENLFKKYNSETLTNSLWNYLNKSYNNTYSSIDASLENTISQVFQRNKKKNYSIMLIGLTKLNNIRDKHNSFSLLNPITHN